MRDSLGAMRHTLWDLAGLLLLIAACRPSDRTPGAGPPGSDHAFAVRDDSIRAAFLHRADTIAPSLNSGGQPLVAAFAAALSQAREDMRGIADPHLYCVSLGPPRALYQVPESIRRQLTAQNAAFVDLDRCDVDRAMAVWVDHRRRGWLLWVETITLDADSASAVVGYHDASMEAATWRCQLRHRGGAWLATRCDLLWIS
jgi:hypothetical protein